MAGFLAAPLLENSYRVGHLLRDAGSKVGLEVMPVDSVALRDGHCPGERTPTAVSAPVPAARLVVDAVQIRSFCVLTYEPADGANG